MGIFGVKTHWIILQKSQNSARYAVARMDDFEKNRRKTFDIMVYIWEKNYNLKKPKKTVWNYSLNSGEKWEISLK